VIEVWRYSLYVLYCCQLICIFIVVRRVRLILAILTRPRYQYFTVVCIVSTLHHHGRWIGIRSDSGARKKEKVYVFVLLIWEIGRQNVLIITCVSSQFRRNQTFSVVRRICGEYPAHEWPYHYPCSPATIILYANSWLW